MNIRLAEDRTSEEQEENLNEKEKYTRITKRAENTGNYFFRLYTAVNS